MVRATFPSTGTPHLWAGSLLSALGLAGWAFEVRVLLPALGFTALLLAVSVSRRPFTLRLADVWTFAFLYLFGSEALLSEERVASLFRTGIIAEAEGFIVSSFGASLVGYALVIRWLRVDDRSPGTPLTSPARPQRIPPSFAMLLACLSVAAIVYVFFIVTPAELFAKGRATRTTEIAGTLRITFVGALLMHVVATLYLARRYRLGGSAIVVFGAVSLMCTAAIYATGTRFYLGFVLSAALFYTVNPFRPLSSRTLVTLFITAIMFMGLQGVIRASRNAGGVLNYGVGSLVTDLSQPEAFLSNEGMLRVNAWVHDKGAYEDPHLPNSNAFLLYWWVPRRFWPSKPTMEGNWLLTSVIDETGYGAGHSVAGGFAMPALLDFGPVGGTLFSLVYGALLAVFELFARRHSDTMSPMSMITSLLPFTVFFMLRSMQTCVMVLTVCVLILIPFVLVERGRVARRRRASAGGRRPRPRPAPALVRRISA